MKPIIGISVDSAPDPQDKRRGGLLTLNWNYAQVIADSGGIPILIPPMADMAAIAQMIHGWLIPGGLDIDAARFGQKNHASVELQDPARYEAEAALFGHLAPDRPVLGICYGCQFLNVARGGTLQQHLPDVVGHDLHTGGTLQEISLSTSKLSGIVGDRIEGKSYHHQAVDRLGAGLVAVGRADDGTIEAIEAMDRPWLIGVQWHPERTWEDPDTQRLFAAFVQAAAAQIPSPAPVQT